MKLASDPNPGTAHDEEKAKAKEGMRRTRSATNVSRNHKSKVEYILQLVDDLTDNEREEFLAAIEERYS
jgi:hypothetical protein